MPLNIEEGEDVVLPCLRCASLSLKLVIRSGTTPIRCPKCGEAVRFHIAGSPAGGFELRAQGEPDHRVPQEPLWS
jgi:DNA-directed RNA polymerase subunit RPC12/RpoP